MKKVIRSICYFDDKPSTSTVEKLKANSSRLTQKEFEIQTLRICSADSEQVLQMSVEHPEILFGLGSVSKEYIEKNLSQFYLLPNLSLNLDLTEKKLDDSDIKILLTIIKQNPATTFNFTYVFNNAPSSPYFPSATYEKSGFCIGLQPPDLYVSGNSLSDWLEKMKSVWQELMSEFEKDSDFLGIDSSTAPLTNEHGSFVRIINEVATSFDHALTTDLFVKITNFIRNQNPKPVGLCGLMLPCLEDNVLAKEYEQGRFSIERNIFLSLHSGLGIDTYPIGIDEHPKRVLEILSLVQALSKKYNKPLSARFVSDGKAKIGERTDFKNEYLADVTIQKL